MLRALKIVESLKLSSIVCIFDQAISSKAIEIKWKEKEKFKIAVLAMGMFLTIMMYMQRDLSIKPSVERCTIDALENAN